MRTSAQQTAVAIAAAIATLAGFAAVSVAISGAAGNARSAKVSVRALPLGDGHYSTTGARRGYVFSCGVNGMGGASAQGPWFNGDGTFDLTRKVTVDGAVSWPQASFSDSIAGSTRALHSTDLPVGGTTGNFPIAATDDAYAYDRNPNSISPQTLTYSLPAHPSKASSPSCLPGGPIGVAINGVAIFDALDAGGRDAVANELQDSCGGHPQQEGMYHYHSMPACLTSSRSHRSKLIGFALDGFPIYNGRDAGRHRLTNADLDSCHGRTSKVKLDGHRVRTYHYEATREFPYTLGCFRGTPVSTGP